MQPPQHQQQQQWLQLSLEQKQQEPPINRGIRFDRPIGAHADVMELEYIAALHQCVVVNTNNNEENNSFWRTNGTVSSHDIRTYLQSRYGISVERDTIQQHVLLDLCGSVLEEDDGNDGTKKNKTVSSSKTIEGQPVMDLCQLTTLLLIPFLRREDSSEARKPIHAANKGFAEHVLELLFEEAEGQGISLEKFQELNDNFEVATRVTPKLIQCLWNAACGCCGSGNNSGEHHNIPQDILEEMVDMAASDDPDVDDSDDAERIFLNKTTFQRALTADVQLYNPDWETAVTTHYEDALEIHNRRRNEESEVEYETFFNAPSVDQGADNYRSHAWTVLLWITFVWSYGCYLSHAYWFDFGDNCVIGVKFVCQAASAIVNALLQFVQVGIVGLIYIELGSIGNSSVPLEPGPRILSAFGVMVGIVVVAAATIVPVFVESDVFIWNTIKEDGFGALYWTGLGLGFILIGLQFIRFFDLLCSLGTLAVGGRTRMEVSTKQAATRKTYVMVENAMLLHCAPAFPGQKRGKRLYAAKYTSPKVVRTSTKLHEANSAREKKLAKSKRKNKNNKTDVPAVSASQKATANYQAMLSLTEEAGGILWSYERILNGGLFQDEGIWIHARLLACNAAQLVVALLSLLALFAILTHLDDVLRNNGVVEITRRLHPSMSTASTTTDYIPSIHTQHFQYHRAIQTYYQQQYHRDLQHHHHPRQQRRRHLQAVARYNSTYYTDGKGVYPNIVVDYNRTHFTDGTNVWDFAHYSHNGTHVFDRYYNYNATHFTDGIHYYAYSQYATNGTHISNGQYLFDGTHVTPLSVPGGRLNNVEGWEYKTALSVGFIAAFSATVGIAVVYIPSFVSTVLKFRGGILSSLRGDERFQQMRNNPDHVSYVFGNALWGAAFTSLVTWAFVGGIVFFSIWSETRDAFTKFYALLIGLILICLLRLLFARLFRELYISIFYRKRPAAMNILNVLFESWGVLVAAGYMLLRGFKLVLLAAIYIGRIDTPMLAPGVGYVGVFALDSGHVGFKKDLLIHEAHRHPYLERLGTLYLMKLRHGPEFGSRAGAYWRLLFVLTLMPWLRDYRASLRDNAKTEEIANDVDEETSYAGSEMTPYGLQLELDITQQANESLTQRNEDLKEALDALREKFRESNRTVKKLEFKLDKAKQKLAEKSAKPKTPDDMQSAAPAVTSSSAAKPKSATRKARHAQEPVPIAKETRSSFIDQAPTQSLQASSSTTRSAPAYDASLSIHDQSFQRSFCANDEAHNQPAEIPFTPTESFIQRNFRSSQRFPNAEGQSGHDQISSQMQESYESQTDSTAANGSASRSVNGQSFQSQPTEIAFAPTESFIQRNFRSSQRFPDVAVSSQRSNISQMQESHGSQQYTSLRDEGMTDHNESFVSEATELINNESGSVR